jgi:hypothetical protein
MSVHCSAFHVSNWRLLLPQERIASYPLGSWPISRYGINCQHVRRFFDARITVEIFFEYTYARILCDQIFQGPFFILSRIESAQIKTPGILNGHLILSTFCGYEKYCMSLWCPQTHLRIPDFEYLHSKIKRIECESVEINYIFSK